MNIESILKTLEDKKETIIRIEESKWKEHRVYDAYEDVFTREENELTLSTVFNDEILEDYSTNEDVLYGDEPEVIVEQKASYFYGKSA